jgi:hypothetical protein
VRLIFKTRWRGFREGAEADLADGVANVLIKRGIAQKAKIQRRRRRKPFIDSAPDPDE